MATYQQKRSKGSDVGRIQWTKKHKMDCVLLRCKPIYIILKQHDKGQDKTRQLNILSS